MSMTGLMRSKEGYQILRASAEAAGGAIEYLYTEKVPQDYSMEVIHAVARNAEHIVATKIEVGVYIDGTRFPLYVENTNVAANKPVTVPRPFYVPEEAQVYAAFDQATASDAISLDVHGILRRDPQNRGER